MSKENWETLSHLKDFVPFVQVLLILAGWLWVSRDNDKREKRKELRALLNKIRECCYQVEAKAIDYYLHDPGEGAGSALAAMRLKAEIGRLALDCSHVNTMSGVSLDASVQDLRMAITGNGLDDATRKKREIQEPVFTQITQAVLVLIEDMEQAFSRTYK